MAVNGIAGQWTGEFSIEGQDIAIDLINVFHEITVRSHIHMDLPSLTFSLKDKGGEMLNRLKLSDGMRASLALGDGGPALPPAENFLLTGNPQVGPPGSGALEISQKGQLAHPAWNKSIWDQAVKGKSGDVIQQLVQRAGLKADVDATDDMMAWLPNNRTLSAYARFLAERAYAGGSSAILTGITETGVFRFKDVEQLIKGPSTLTIGRGTNEFPYLEHMFTSKGAIYNPTRGYGSTTAQDKGEGTLVELNKIGASLLSGDIGIGKAFSDAAGALGVRVEFSPIDCGNVHAKYRDAIHQNRRIKGTYSEDAKVMLDRVTGLQLLDKVQFNPVGFLGEPIESYCGPYIVTGKVKQVLKNRYYEILTLTTQGQS